MKDSKFTKGVRFLMQYYKGGIILDLGPAQDKCYKDAIGIDKNPKANPDICCDIEKGLPFKDNEVSYIVGLDILEHLHDVNSFLVELHRILKPKGIAAFMLPDTRWVPARLNANPDHKHWWSPKTFREEVLIDPDRWKILSYDKIRNYWWFDLIIQS